MDEKVKNRILRQPCAQLKKVRQLTCNCQSKAMSEIKIASAGPLKWGFLTA